MFLQGLLVMKNNQYFYFSGKRLYYYLANYTPESSFGKDNVLLTLFVNQHTFDKLKRGTGRLTWFKQMMWQLQ